MLRRMHRVLGLVWLAPLLLPWLGGCEQRVVLGDLESVGTAGASSIGGASGGGTGGTAAGGTVVFSSGFETGDLSEWGLEGSSLTVAGGELAVSQAVAHGGSSALLVATETVDQHVVLSLDADYPKYVFGFWMRLSQTVSSLDWVLLNVDEVRDDGSIGELFDVSLRTENGAPGHLFVREKPALTGSGDTLEVGISDAPVPVGPWRHVEVAVTVATDGTGALQVIEDGQLTIDLPDRPTSTGGLPHLSVGSFAYELEPLPAELWLDDISLSTP